MTQQHGASDSLSVQLAGPFSAGGSAASKLTEITLPLDGWKGAVSPYSQVVAVEGISISSMVDLQPAPDQLEQLRGKEIAFLTENEEGIVTVFAIGQKPDADYTFQATIQEVSA